MSAPPLDGAGLTSGALAERLGAELRGPASVRLLGVDALDRAGPGTLSFVRDARNLSALSASRCGAALISRSTLDGAAGLARGHEDRALLIVDDADRALIAALTLFERVVRPEPGAHPSAVIDPSARIGRAVHIGPGVIIRERADIGDGSILHAQVVIGTDVRVGPACVLHPSCVVLDRCVLGARVQLHSGVIIGTDGFGYRPSADGKSLVKIPHLGTVEIGDDVEIGANTAIDRGKFGATTIGAGTKLDNLVQIGHNCRIGRCCIICGTSAIAGSVTIGDGVTLAGGVGIADGLSVGSGATIGARSGVMCDVPAGETWLGYPARPVRQTMRLIAMLDQLPEIWTRVRKMFPGDAGEPRQR